LKQAFKSGFVTIIGRPNVGKSTLINKLLGQKVLIMSDKPQTTRNKIQCVLTDGDAQIIFLDTPGIHKPQHKLGEYMVKTARSTLTEVDAVCLLVDGSVPPGKGDQFIAQELQAVKVPVFLVMNKTDLLPAGQQAKHLQSYAALHNFKDTFIISALRGINLNHLLAGLKAVLPPGPKYYPDDVIVDRPERFIVAELIREQILHHTNEEIPHAVAIEIEEMKERNDGMVYIRAVIYTERESQKGIIIGRNGQMLKRIGTGARNQIERLLGSQIYLDLWVKVNKEWRNAEKILQTLGYRPE